MNWPLLGKTTFCYFIDAEFSFHQDSELWTSSSSQNKSRSGGWDHCNINNLQLSQPKKRLSYGPPCISNQTWVMKCKRQLAETGSTRGCRAAAYGSGRVPYVRLMLDQPIGVCPAPHVFSTVGHMVCSSPAHFSTV